MSNPERFDSLDDALQAAINLRAEGTNSLWLLGDCVLAARATFGPGVVRNLSGATGYTGKWLNQLAQVSAIWPPDQRQLSTSWDIYNVAGTMGEQAHQWLNAAISNGWSAADLRRAIVKERGGTSQDSKQAAVRFCQTFKRIWPYLRKELGRPRMKPYQEEWYNNGLDDIINGLQDALTVARAFEASKR